MISRIKAIISHYGMSARAFAMRCNLKDNTFINQMNGVRELSLTTVVKILLSFEEISAEWLIRGKGEMLLSQGQMQVEGDRVNKLIDTIAFLQLTVDNQRDELTKLKMEKDKLTGELLLLKNERKIG